MSHHRINPNTFVVVFVHLVEIFGVFSLSSLPPSEQTNKNSLSSLEKSQLTKIAKRSAGEGTIYPCEVNRGLR